MLEPAQRTGKRNHAQDAIINTAIDGIRGIRGGNHILIIECDQKELRSVLRGLDDSLLVSEGVSDLLGRVVCGLCREKWDVHIPWMAGILLGGTLIKVGVLLERAGFVKDEDECTIH